MMMMKRADRGWSVGQSARDGRGLLSPLFHRIEQLINHSRGNGSAHTASSSAGMARRLRTLWLLILKEVRATKRACSSSTLNPRRMHGKQTQTIVTLATALSILHLRNLHSVYIGAGATVAAVVGECGATPARHGHRKTDRRA